LSANRIKSDLQEKVDGMEEELEKTRKDLTQQRAKDTEMEEDLAQLKGNLEKETESKKKMHKQIIKH